ncbi:MULTISPECIES: oxygen-independent coproporphyrinogen III oxidase [unclassified Acinetobacter]|uniref:oxygen-independent coproporphyrinogen III oxidase n=1 Tax=unclassified Acinetobacter TaxID=196816 RepID=UPI0035B6D095
MTTPTSTPLSATLDADEQPFLARSEHSGNPYASDARHYAPTEHLFDEVMIEKYNRQGPRYTSYPTALEFQPIAEGAESKILQQRNQRVPLSLYFHIPFCRHLCYYCACNKIITKKNADAGNYLDYLFAEIRQKRALLQGEPVVEQLHLGGGTPTFLSDEELVKLWQFLQSQFTLSTEPTADYSIEIDPRELRPNTLKVLRELGFNRVSFGVQDLEEKVQIAVNRVQSESMIQQVMYEARALGFRSINIDLIYGLPHQTVESMRHTVERIIAMSPDRLSVFNYAHLPERFKGQRQINDADLPNPSDKLAMLGNTINALSTAGYQYIGIDHFAKPDDELAIAQRAGKLHRNFQGYTTHGNCDLLGFGVSSISQIGENYLQNSTDLTEYKAMVDGKQLPAVKRIQAKLPDQLRRYVIMNLLCHDYIDFKDINSRFSVDPTSYFIEEIQQLAEMQADQLISMDGSGIRILPKGRLLGRNVAMVFDSYLGKKHQNRFSKVI